MRTARIFQTRTSFLVLALMVGLLCSQSTLALAADEAGTDAGIQVTMKFGTGIDSETRGLVGEAVEFPAGCKKVFCYTNISGAIKMAEKGQADSIDKTEEMNDEDYRESKDLLDLYRENIQVWTAVIHAEKENA